MRTNREHIEQANRYADAVLATVTDAGTRKVPLSARDLDLSRTLLAAAEVEIRLSQIQELHDGTVPE